MNFIKRDDAKPAKEMIEIFINHELGSISKDSYGKMFDLSHLTTSLPFDGTIYKIMDEVCNDLNSNGWHCYYKHWYTFTARVLLWVSPNEIKDKPVSQFKYFVPYSHEWNKKDNIYFPEKA